MTSQSEGKSTAAMPPIKRRYLPSLGAFATFEVAAKHLSFTLAAKELNVTQGAVSQQIRILEDTVGAPLFRREARGLVLTDAARAAQPLLREGFERLAEASALLRQDDLLTQLMGFVAEKS